MNNVPHERIIELLGGPHQAVLSVNRSAKGPLGVPMSYVYDGETFAIVTSPNSLHGRLMTTEGRATLTIHADTNEARSVHQWYIVAEGPVTFTELEPEPVIREILAKDRGAATVDEWMERMGHPEDVVVHLTPARISGFESVASLD